MPETRFCQEIIHQMNDKILMGNLKVKFRRVVLVVIKKNIKTIHFIMTIKVVEMLKIKNLVQGKTKLVNILHL